MALPKHLENAVARLEQASSRMEVASKAPLTLESLRDWIAALTDYARSSVEIQELNNESVHEKLHELAGRIGLRQFPSSGSKT